MTGEDALHRIGKKGTVGISDTDIDKYELVVQLTGETLQRKQKLESYSLKQKVRKQSVVVAIVVVI